MRDSSLSACTQAVMAAEVGHLDLAYDYLAEAALMDLGDLEHNTRDGLHMASLAGAWIALVAGFGGMRASPSLSFAPRLPAAISRLTFRLCYRGRHLSVTVTPASATYELLDGGRPSRSPTTARPSSSTVRPSSWRSLRSRPRRPRPSRPAGRRPSVSRRCVAGPADILGGSSFSSTQRVHADELGGWIVRSGPRGRLAPGWVRSCALLESGGRSAASAVAGSRRPLSERQRRQRSRAKRSGR